MLLQILAYRGTVLRGTDVDQSRDLAKSATVNGRPAPTPAFRSRRAFHAQRTPEALHGRGGISSSPQGQILQATADAASVSAVRTGRSRRGISHRPSHALA
ncbi:MAG TPA: hypothetical protein VGC30_02090 [Dokdonella sp.]